LSQLSFNPPPGIFHTGTEREAAGRWYNGNLVRWTNGVLRPVYGWQAHSTSAVSGAARGMMTWRDNQASSWIGIGTHSHLYVMDRAGVLYDITPAGYTAGRVDATAGGGYGSGPYGRGSYGAPTLDTSNILDATVWTLDSWGQNMVGVTPDDNKIYQWVAPTTGTIAGVITNSPAANALVVTSERFLFALGSTDPRTVSWCDQEAITVWAPTVTNQAGSFPLQTFGRLMCGKRLSGGTGLWTDTDMWLATYIGGSLVYGFQKVGNGCGVVSRQAVAVSNAQAAWMGPQGFWIYNGYVQGLPCDVQDYVFGNINRTQLSKVYAVLNSQFNEVWWYYPSATSTEVDSAVSWNYTESTWMVHALARTCGADAGGAFLYPLAVNPADSLIYEHESGFGYSGAMPYAETGPLEFAPLTATYSGDSAKVWQATAFIPDELLEGDVTATFTSRIYPNGNPLISGPYTLKPQTDVRFTARQTRMKITAARNDDWRFGAGRLLVNGRGNR
jgi:hypothetical protein